MGFLAMVETATLPVGKVGPRKFELGCHRRNVMRILTDGKESAGFAEAPRLRYLGSEAFVSRIASGF